MLLLKKAARTVWRAKKSYIACISLMTIGIMMYVTFNISHLNLLGAMNSMYEQQRFGDGFAQVAGMSAGHIDALEAIPGIEKVSGTLTVDAKADMPGVDKLVTLRLISYDPAEEDRLNDPYLESGALPGDHEIMVNKSFAQAHLLSPGDTVAMVVQGRELKPVVSGTGQSPEYVYAIKDISEMMPDAEAFGIAFLPLQRLSAAIGRAGEVNALSFRLEDGVGWDDVKFQLEDALAPYGLISLIPRKDQLSHSMLDMELTSIGGMSTSVPMLFVFMAVIILYIMLKRVIEQERGQIGILKAFGFSDGALIAHYLGYGLITGVTGGVLGVIFGVLLSGVYSDLFAVYFNLPSLRADVSPAYIFIGMALAAGSGALGALMGARAMLKLSPSEAMRPPAPPIVKGDLIGKLPGLRYILSSHGFMAIRSISRSKFRSAFVVLGISFSFAIMAFIASYNSMFDALLLDQFTKSQLFDLRITMASPAAYTRLLESVYRLNGVQTAEAILEVPVELSLGHLKKGTLLTAMREDSSLYKIYDNERKINLTPPKGGVILSSSIAKELNAKRGSLLMLNAPTAGREDIPVTVLDVVSENVGSAAYMELESLWDMLDIPPSATSAIVRAGDMQPIKDALRGEEAVASVTDQAQAKKVFDDMLQTYGSMFYFMQLAGIGIAYAIITNTSSISLSERKREYATLRVLGMQPKEVGRIMAFEYWVLTVLGALAGIPLVYMFKAAMNDMMGSDMFSIPMTTPLNSYLQAAALCWVAVTISNLSSRRRIATFDMVDVLKERE